MNWPSREQLLELRRALPIIAAALFVGAVFFPMWVIEVHAVQYPDTTLIVKLYAYPHISGDYVEMSRLNTYVGFHYPDPVFWTPNYEVSDAAVDVPEWSFGWIAFVAVSALSIFVAVAPSTEKLKRGLKWQLIGTVAVFVIMLADIQYRLYQAGHNLDPNAPVMGVKGFTPPLWGRYEVANITSFSYFGVGAYMAGTAIFLLAVAYYLRGSEITFGDLADRVGQRVGRGKSPPTPEKQNEPATDGGSDREQPRGRVVKWSAVVTVLILLGASIAIASGGPGPTSARTAGYDFDPPVPREYDFDADPDDYPAGTASVGGTEYDTVAAALAAAERGDVITLAGWFDATPVVNTSGITFQSAPGTGAVINGSGVGDVLTINAANVTIRDVWVRNSGYNPAKNDAAIWINDSNVHVIDCRLTEFTFGIWIDGTPKAYIANNTIVGRERVLPLTMRGNGIQVWETSDSLIVHNRITDVRDGIYYSFADRVTARYNVMWDMRYGVHYMYSDDCTLRRNLAFGNDVGWSLMVSRRLHIVDNIAFNNTGRSGHGILVKSIDDSVIRGNAVIANENGFYVYNSVNDSIVGNLVLDNAIGINHQAGSMGAIYGNSFIRNDRSVYVLTSRQLAWNGTERGNYWSAAQTVDPDKDGASEVRYRPSGLVQHLIHQNPTVAVFAHSPAFAAIRMAQSSFPILESPGVIDFHPLVQTPHDHWTRWYRDGHNWSWYENWESERTGARTTVRQSEEGR